MLNFLSKFRQGSQPASNLMPEHEAYLTIVAAAALCDKKLTSEEVEEIHALCHRLKIFIELPTGELNSMVERVMHGLGRDFDRAVLSALQSIKEDMKRSLFIQALDIISADREVNEPEEIFLTDLAVKLGIDGEFKENAAEIIAIKNGFST